MVGSAVGAAPLSAPSLSKALLKKRSGASGLKIRKNMSNAKRKEISKPKRPKKDVSFWLVLRHLSFLCPFHA